MATAYTNSSLYANQVYTMVGVNYAPFACDISKLASSFTGFVINDTVNLVRIPNRYMLVDFFVDLCALDSSTGVVTSLGDNGPDTTHGMAGAGGFTTGMTLGRSSAAGTIRAGGTGFVHGAIPWIYSVPYASEPSIGIWLMLKVTTAPTGTHASTGTISGWVAYQSLAELNSPSGTGGTNPF
jgi:hypothetical protein